MEEKIWYQIIPKTTIEILQLNAEHTLDETEVWLITVHRKLLAKFLRQYTLNYQLELWKWLLWEKTSLWFEVVQELSKIAKQIENIDKVFNEFREEQRKQEQKEK